MNSLLQIEGLTTVFSTEHGNVKAVDNLSLNMERGEILSIVGESGCGKSMTGLSVMRLVPSPPGRIVSGRILFNGVDLLTLSDAQMRRIRGLSISMIFQEPMSALNPVFTAGNQIMEALFLHQSISRRSARARVLELLEHVAIPDPVKRFDEYPHELSGGMRQRVMIAMALACTPDLLIADEPTTALDVTIQAQILDLLLRLSKESGLSILLITHDLGVVAETADRMAVMYAGRLVETGSVSDVFMDPLHPYTRGLLHSVPSVETDSGTTDSDATFRNPRRRTLPAIPGNVPSLSDLPPGCAFAPRCTLASADCTCPSLLADMTFPKPGRSVRCVLYNEKT